jgi:hypothetical protein
MSLTVPAPSTGTLTLWIRVSGETATTFLSPQGQPELHRARHQQRQPELHRSRHQQLPRVHQTHQLLNVLVQETILTRVMSVGTTHVIQR